MRTEGLRTVIETRSQDAIHRLLFKNSGEPRNFRSGSVVFLAGVAVGAAAASSESVKDVLNAAVANTLFGGERVLEVTRNHLPSRLRRRKGHGNIKSIGSL